jgi:hypothetical protein
MHVVLTALGRMAILGMGRFKGVCGLHLHSKIRGMSRHAVQNGPAIMEIDFEKIGKLFNDSGKPLQLHLDTLG